MNPSIQPLGQAETAHAIVDGAFRDIRATGRKPMGIEQEAEAEIQQNEADCDARESGIKTAVVGVFGAIGGILKKSTHAAGSALVRLANVAETEVEVAAKAAEAQVIAEVETEAETLLPKV